MNAKTLRWLFVLVLVAGFVITLVYGSVAPGASAEWSGDSYRFAGGTHPIAMGFAVAILTLYLTLVFSAPSPPGPPLPGVVRRFLTFWLDFLISMMMITPVMGILPTVMEWRRTGNFQWSFERTTRAPSDTWVLILVTVVTWFGLVAYYSIPLLRRRQSPGSCITGYQVVPDDGIDITPRTALLRTMLGLVALSVAWLAPFVARSREQGKFWLDKVSGTHAVTVL
jgi:uncharacterized RDD family membrane protein YckC